jgi:hypothetical protein
MRELNLQRPERKKFAVVALRLPGGGSGLSAIYG